MKTLILAVLLAPLATYAGHVSFVATYCIDGSSRELKKVEAFDTHGRGRLEWWSPETYADDDNGVEAWMAQQLPGEWREHDTKLYKVMVEDCGRVL